MFVPLSSNPLLATHSAGLGFVTQALARKPCVDGHVAAHVLVVASTCIALAQSGAVGVAVHISLLSMPSPVAQADTQLSVVALTYWLPAERAVQAVCVTHVLVPLSSNPLLATHSAGVGSVTQALARKPCVDRHMAAHVLAVNSTRIALAQSGAVGVAVHISLLPMPSFVAQADTQVFMARLTYWLPAERSVQMVWLIHVLVPLSSNPLLATHSAAVGLVTQLSPRRPCVEGHIELHTPPMRICPLARMQSSSSGVAVHTPSSPSPSPVSQSATQLSISVLTYWLPATRAVQAVCVTHVLVPLSRSRPPLAWHCPVVAVVVHRLSALKPSVVAHMATQVSIAALMYWLPAERAMQKAWVTHVFVPLSRMRPPLATHSLAVGVVVHRSSAPKPCVVAHMATQVSIVVLIYWLPAERAMQSASVIHELVPLSRSRPPLAWHCAMVVVVVHVLVAVLSPSVAPHIATQLFMFVLTYWLPPLRAVHMVEVTHMLVPLSRRRLPLAAQSLAVGVVVHALARSPCVLRHMAVHILVVASTWFMARWQSLAVGVVVHCPVVFCPCPAVHAGTHVSAAALMNRLPVARLVHRVLEIHVVVPLSSRLLLAVHSAGVVGSVTHWLFLMPCAVGHVLVQRRFVSSTWLMRVQSVTEGLLVQISSAPTPSPMAQATTQVSRLALMNWLPLVRAVQAAVVIHCRVLVSKRSPPSAWH